MSNPSKQKGTAFETQCVNYLKTWFPRIYRPALQGGMDTGDINGVLQELEETSPEGQYTWYRHLIFQCKNHKAFKLSEWMKATKEQAANKAEGTLVEEAVGVLLVKRKGVGDQNMGKTYAIMELEDLVNLLLEAGYD